MPSTYAENWTHAHAWPVTQCCWQSRQEGLLVKPNRQALDTVCLKGKMYKVIEQDTQHLLHNTQ